MNEALFSKGRFSKARAVGRPDFEVLLTLTCLRQVNTPTAKAAMAIPLKAACVGDSIAILCGHDVDHRDQCASFYDLSSMPWAHPMETAKNEAAVNRGISVNFQSPSLNAVFGLETKPSFEGI